MATYYFVNDSSYQIKFYYNFDGSDSFSSYKTVSAGQQTSITTTSSTMYLYQDGFYVNNSIINASRVTWKRTSPSTGTAYPLDEDNVINLSAYSSGATYTFYVDYTAPPTTTTYYAKITFNLNGGSGSFSDLSGSTTNSNTYVTLTLPTTKPTRSGYTFKGWTIDDGSTVFSAGANVSVSGTSGSYKSHTAYAQWEKNVVTTYKANIKFTSSIGSPSGMPSNYTDEDVTSSWSIQLPSAPTLTGYTFAGWKKSGVTYSAGEYVTVNGSTSGTDNTFEAQWTANSYTITFNKQSGTGGSSSVTTYYGSYVPDISVPDRDGYTFGGYFTSAGGSGTQYYDKDGNGLVKWSRTSGITLYAYWTSESYTITFDKQSGSGGTSSITVDYGDTLQSITVPTRTGYTFQGYYSQTNGGGTRYYTSSGSPVSTSVTVASNMTLYAYWKQNPVVLTIKCGTGIDSVTLSYRNAENESDSITINSSVGSNIEVYQNTNVTISSVIINNSYTYPVYMNASTVVYNSSGSQTTSYFSSGTSNATYTFTATKKTTSYYASIKFTSSIGSPTGMPNDYIDENTSETWSIDFPTDPKLTGYTFNGWEKDGVTYKYSSTVKELPINGSTSTSGKLNTFEAQWQANTYTISLNQQGGIDGDTSVIATYGSTMPTINTPTRIGYEFQGYYTSMNGVGTKYYNSAGSGLTPLNRTDLTTLYAHWVADSYTVTLNANGGSGGKTSVTATYGQELPALLSSDLPTRSGYTFNGYYTSTSGGTCYYNSDGSSTDSTWNTAGAGTLYARWTANSSYAITVNFNTNGGTPIDSIYETDTVSNSSKFTITLPTPQREGYSLDYWEYNGQQKQPGDTISFTGYQGGKFYTVNAVWKSIGYYVKIIFDANGGTYYISEQTYEGTVDGVHVILPTEVPTHQSGLTFQGWGFEGYPYEAGADCGLIQGAPNVEDATYTLVAIWTNYMATFTFVNPEEYTNVENMPSNYFAEGETNVITTTIPAEMPLSPGYTFQYWECSDGNQYFPSQEAQFTLDASNVEFIFTAVYLPNTYTITFDDTGNQMIVTYDSVLESIVPPAPQQGFVFGGYYSVTDNVQVLWYDGYGNSNNMPWNIPYDTTLYAYWVQSGTIAEDGGVYINGLYYIPYIYYNGGWCQAKAHVYTYGWTVTKKQIQ